MIWVQVKRTRCSNSSNNVDCAPSGLFQIISCNITVYNKRVDVRSAVSPDVNYRYMVSVERNEVQIKFPNNIVVWSRTNEPKLAFEFIMPFISRSFVTARATTRSCVNTYIYCHPERAFQVFATPRDNRTQIIRHAAQFAKYPKAFGNDIQLKNIFINNMPFSGCCQSTSRSLRETRAVDRFATNRHTLLLVGNSYVTDK